jgi:hypothetical protein
MGLAQRADMNFAETLHVVTIAADALIPPNGSRLHDVARLPGHTQWPLPEPLESDAQAEITSWEQFHLATAQRPLLARLDDYGDALLIAGCDRSAATAVTRLFKRLSCFADSGYGHDDELDGALLLAGLRGREHPGRHCFQTSYVDRRFEEYFDHSGYRLIWIVREPRAAVCSLLGDRQKKPGRSAASTLGQGASRLEKACAAYIAAIEQTLELEERLGARVAIVDYDALAADRARLVPALCRFASVDCSAELLGHLHGKSVRKGALASWEASIVDELALGAYRRAISCRLGPWAVAGAQ